ncbi:MAG: PIN domain-containing protein [Chloroflexi bacterium]|nr:PIN domain-containing protein [Chloroflexota bacterium]
MRVVFADAAYWIALWNPRDAMHEQALAVAARLGSAAVVTTHIVLIEALNFMAGMGEFRRLFAARMVRDLEDNPDVEIVPQTAAQFRSAVDRYVARPDQTWGLSDCASFLLMEERNITEALTHDRDFEQAGFTALLR